MVDAIVGYDNTIQFPELYSISSNGKIKYWSISVTKTEEGFGDICTKHGYVDGKIQERHKLIKKGKNIGKKNETNPFEQATKESESKWNSKRDQNYQQTIPKEGDAPKFNLPMLAHSYKDRSHDIKFPAFVQPKFNGVRCFAIRKGDEIEFQSRNGKPYKLLSHMIPEFINILDDGEILDGEVYVHGWHFQKIISAIKKINDDTQHLQFFAYDLAIPRDNYTFESRYIDLVKKLSMDQTKIVDKYKYIKLTPTTRITKEDQIFQLHDKYVQNGFEGAMIRNKNGIYRFNYRSKDLQKYKEFEDKEFEIVDGVEGTGDEEGCVIFVCKNEDGNLFRVRPKGTRELRRHWLENIHLFKGDMLTVRYQERSADNIPIFPVGIVIRDYE